MTTAPEREAWPRLSAMLEHERRPDRCQSCGGAGELTRWQECDAWDRPEPIIVVLCRPCEKRLIQPHPRLYRQLYNTDPWPGCMEICVACRHRQGTRCGHASLKANGGPGLAVTVPKGTPMHLNFGGGRGEFRTLYPHQPRECAGRVERQPCGVCSGDGRIPVGEHLVTRDMAIDAGDRSLEGTLFDVEYAPCSACRGAGWVEVSAPTVAA